MSDPLDTGELAAIPHGIAATWGVAAAPQRGPKRELTLEKITEAAIEIADAEGLEAVSMSRVATNLGFTPMSLYRYVSGKEDLLQLMFDAAAAVPLASFDGSWREQLVQWGSVVRAGYRAHPWMAAMPPSATPSTPNRLAIVEAGMHAQRDLGVSANVRLTITMLLLGYIGMFQQASRDPLDDAVRRVLPDLVTADRFPTLAPLVADGLFAKPMEDSDRVFFFGFNRLLDGIEVWLDSPDADAVRDLDRDHSLPAEITRDGRVRDAMKAVREAEEKLRTAQSKAAAAIDRVTERERKAAERAAAKAAKKRGKDD